MANIYKPVEPEPKKILKVPNAWVKHVRAFALENGLSYGCALSKPECKSSYQKPLKKSVKKSAKKSVKKSAKIFKEVDSPVEPIKKKTFKITYKISEDAKRDDYMKNLKKLTGVYNKRRGVMEQLQSRKVNEVVSEPEPNITIRTSDNIRQLAKYKKQLQDDKKLYLDYLDKLEKLDIRIFPLQTKEEIRLTDLKLSDLIDEAEQLGLNPKGNKKKLIDLILKTKGIKKGVNFDYMDGRYSYHFKSKYLRQVYCFIGISECNLTESLKYYFDSIYKVDKELIEMYQSTDFETDKKAISNRISSQIKKEGLRNLRLERVNELMPTQKYLDDVYEEIERMNPEYSKDAEFKHVEEPIEEPEPVKNKFKITYKKKVEEPDVEYSEDAKGYDYMKNLKYKKTKSKMISRFSSNLARFKEEFDASVARLEKINIRYFEMFNDIDTIFKMTIHDLKDALKIKGRMLSSGSKKEDYLKEFFVINRVPYETRKLTNHQSSILRLALYFFGYTGSGGYIGIRFKPVVIRIKQYLNELIKGKISKAYDSKADQFGFTKTPYHETLQYVIDKTKEFNEHYEKFKELPLIYKKLDVVKLEDDKHAEEQKKPAKVIKSTESKQAEEPKKPAKVVKPTESKQAEEPKKPDKFIKVIPILEVDKNLSEDQLKELHLQTKFFNIILSRYYSACNNEKNDKLPDLYDDIRQRSRDIRTKYGYLLDWVVCKNKKTKEDSRRAIQKDKDNARKAFEEKKKLVQKQKDTKQEFEQDID